MSSGSWIFDASMPDRFQQQVRSFGPVPPVKANSLFRYSHAALKSQHKDKPYVFQLLRADEELTPIFFQCFKLGGHSLGVIVVTGQSFPEGVIVGVSPSGQRMRLRPWLGSAIGFGAEQWEIEKFVAEDEEQENNGLAKHETPAGRTAQNQESDEEYSDIKPIASRKTRDSLNRSKDNSLLDEDMDRSIVARDQGTVNYAESQDDYSEPGPSTRLRPRSSHHTRQNSPPQLTRQSPADSMRHEQQENTPEGPQLANDISSLRPYIAVQFMLNDHRVNRVLRERPWEECNSGSSRLFGQALVAGTVQPMNNDAVLGVQVDEKSINLMRGDKQDFDELARVVDEYATAQQVVGELEVVIQVWGY